LVIDDYEQRTEVPTITTYASEKFDYKPKNLQQEMTFTLSAVIDRGETLSENEIRSLLETIWCSKMFDIKINYDPKDSLNDLMEHVCEKYRSLENIISSNNLFEEVTTLLEMSTVTSSLNNKDQIEKWETTLNDKVIGLGTDCITEANIILPYLSGLSTNGKYISIDFSNIELDSNDAIRCSIFMELMNDPLRQSNTFRLDRFIEEICEKILISIVSKSSVISSENGLFEEIIGYINHTINEANRELNDFKWKLSEYLISTIHTNVLALLIFFYQKERETEFRQQLDDLEKIKPTLLENFIQMMAYDAR
jgi:hypothetical protein